MAKSSRWRAHGGWYMATFFANKTRFFPSYPPHWDCRLHVSNAEIRLCILAFSRFIEFYAILIRFICKQIMKCFHFSPFLWAFPFLKCRKCNFKPKLFINLLILLRYEMLLTYLSTSNHKKYFLEFSKLVYSDKRMQFQNENTASISTSLSAKTRRKSLIWHKWKRRALLISPFFQMSSFISHAIAKESRQTAE